MPYQLSLRMALYIAGAFAAGLVAAKVPAYVHAPVLNERPSVFLYLFTTPGILQETSTSTESTSPYFWLDSGGQLLIGTTTGSTLIGDIGSDNPWHRAYEKSNPRDTDRGVHPQNLFRLVTKDTRENVRQELAFEILADHFSATPYRNSSNGVLLMSRYRDRGQTLYYAGLRVDGTAVIKKKYKGTYYTMAQKKVFAGTYTDDRDSKNLLPHDTWIVMRVDTRTNEDGSVSVTLSLVDSGEEPVTELLTATDTGEYGGTPPIVGAQNTGIRTDFMDVAFRSYILEAIGEPQ